MLPCILAAIFRDIESWPLNRSGSTNATPVDVSPAPDPAKRTGVDVALPAVDPDIGWVDPEITEWPAPLAGGDAAGFVVAWSGRRDRPDRGLLKATMGVHPTRPAPPVSDGRALAKSPWKRYAQQVARARRAGG